jgi:hypothetical protein
LGDIPTCRRRAVLLRTRVCMVPRRLLAFLPLGAGRINSPVPVSTEISCLIRSLNSTPTRTHRRLCLKLLPSPALWLVVPKTPPARPPYRCTPQHNATIPYTFAHTLCAHTHTHTHSTSQYNTYHISPQYTPHNIHHGWLLMHILHTRHTPMHSLRNIPLCTYNTPAHHTHRTQNTHHPRPRSSYRHPSHTYWTQYIHHTTYIHTPHTRLSYAHYTHPTRTPALPRDPDFFPILPAPRYPHFSSTRVTSSRCLSPMLSPIFVSSLPSFCHPQLTSSGFPKLGGGWAWRPAWPG